MSELLLRMSAEFHFVRINTADSWPCPANNALERQRFYSPVHPKTQAAPAPERKPPQLRLDLRNRSAQIRPRCAIHKSSQLPITHLPIYPFTNLPIYQFPHLPIYQLTHLPIFFSHFAVAFCS